MGSNVAGISSHGKEHIGVEEVEEIKHLCTRIYEIKNEIRVYKTDGVYKIQSIIYLYIKSFIEYKTIKLNNDVL